MRKVDIMIARFPGNNQEHPDSVNWVIDAMMRAKQDERIGRVIRWHKADTPIDMVRNECVQVAQEEGVDILFMIDNDMTPDTAGGKKFFDVAIDFLYGRLAPAVIAAPYVGGGQNNNVFVFQWRNANNGPQHNFGLVAYEREEAADMTGIAPAAALPTGLIAYDMRVFDRLKATGKGYFYYEMNDRRTKKESTEDVTNTRDISLAWNDMDGAGCFCAWDCWASHNKIVPCEKPRKISPEAVGDVLYHEFERRRQSETETIAEMDGAGIVVADLVDAMRNPNNNGRISYVDEQAIAGARARIRQEFSELSNGKPEEI